MVPPENLLAFVLASLLIIPVPGPSVVFVVGRSIALGRRGGLLSVLGNTLGYLPLVALVAVGVGALVAASAVAFTSVKIVGAGYLVWLGVQAIRHRHRAAASTGRGARGPLRLVAEGFVVGAANPKTLAFFVAVLPQFVDPRAGSVPLQMAVLGAVFTLLACVSDGIWAVAAGTARDWFARSPRRLSGMAIAGGIAMIGLGGAMLFTSSASSA